MRKAKKISSKENQERRNINGLISVSSKNTKLIEKKHKEIVQGACKLFFKKGYHPTSIREIAESCGMSMGQLYHYISSKDDILYLVHKHLEDVWHEYLIDLGVEKIKDPLQRLIKILHYSMEFMIKNKKLMQFVFSEARNLDKRHLNVVLASDKKNVAGFFRKLLREMNKQKAVIRDIDLEANLIAYLTVFFPLRGWSVEGGPTEKNIDSTVDFILRGLGLNPQQRNSSL